MQRHTDATTDPLPSAMVLLSELQDSLVDLADAFAQLAAGYDNTRAYTTIALCLREAVEQVHAAREELAGL